MSHFKLETKINNNEWGTYDDIHIFDEAENYIRFIGYNRTSGIIHLGFINSNNQLFINSYNNLPPYLMTSIVQTSKSLYAKKSTLLLYSPLTGRLDYADISTSDLRNFHTTLWRKNLSHLTNFFLNDVSPADGMILAYSNKDGGAQLFRINDRTKLTCNNIDKCEFKKLPLLNQVDNRIPENPYSEAKKYGCYDASIAMTTASAINNSAFFPTPPNGSRASKIKTLTDAFGINTYYLTRFQYDSVFDKDNYYFNKALLEYGSEELRKLPEYCNLSYLYDCTSVETKNGDYSKLWAYDGASLKSEDVIESVLSGTTQIIAINWSINMYFGDAKVVIHDSRKHKVVIAGFDKTSEFPLLINDPSDGSRKQARIVNLEKSPSYILVTEDGKAISKWPALEFQGSPGSYQFIEHIDHFRLH